MERVRPGKRGWGGSLVAGEAVAVAKLRAVGRHGVGDSDLKPRPDAVLAFPGRSSRY